MLSSRWATLLSGAPLPTAIAFHTAMLKAMMFLMLVTPMTTNGKLAMVVETAMAKTSWCVSMARIASLAPSLLPMFCHFTECYGKMTKPSFATTNVRILFTKLTCFTSVPCLIHLSDLLTKLFGVQLELEQTQGFPQTSSHRSEMAWMLWSLFQWSPKL